jgi:dienelactone hydrolase
MAGDERYGGRWTPRRDVRIPAPDGHSHGTLHVPDGDGPWPGVLVFPDAGGARETFGQMGDRLADPARHGFAVPDNPTYDATAEARHWEALGRLYRDHLGG